MLARVLADVVCLCVGHRPVLYRNCCTNQADFCVYRFTSTYATLYFREIRVSLKIRVLAPGTASQILDLENFAMARRPSASAI